MPVQETSTIVRELKGRQRTIALIENNTRYIVVIDGQPCFSAKDQKRGEHYYFRACHAYLRRYAPIRAQ